MASTELHPSAGLRRAVTSELQRLARRRDRLEKRLAELREEQRRLAAELRGLEEQGRLLEQLAGGAEPGPALAAEAPAGAVALRGSAIAREAARLLAERRGDEDVHYRELFDALLRAGFAVGGKDALATFLTNISRSAFLRRGSAPGSYRLDRDAAGRLRSQLAELQAELRDLTGVTAREVAPTEALKQHRARLLGEIKRAESQLAEAEDVLGVSPAPEAEREAA